MKIVLIPLLKDNYGYLLIDSDGVAAVIDPVEPEKVLKAAEEQGVTISQILTTHNHWDHAGGNEEFAKRFPSLPIVGGVNDNVPAANRTVSDGEVFSVGKISVKALETPFHTLGHICYLCEEAGTPEKAIFTGDTLFLAGCGRCFAGTAEQMYGSLIGKLSKLSPEYLVYCGHEYSVSNLKFAAHADKENKAVAEKLAWAESQRAKGLPTIPSTLGEELAYNPFLRSGEPELVAFSGKSGEDPVAVLAEIRLRKDKF